MSELVGHEYVLDELRKLAGVEFVAQIGPKIMELQQQNAALHSHQQLHDRIFARQQFLIDELRKKKP